MHAVAFVINPSSCHQVRAQWIILWQVCCEIHLLPLELLAQILLSRKSKLSEVPALDEVYLPISWLGVNLVWVALSLNKNFIIGTLSVLDICPVVSQQKGVLFPSEPSLSRRKLKQA